MLLVLDKNTVVFSPLPPFLSLLLPFCRKHLLPLVSFSFFLLAFLFLCLRAFPLSTTSLLFLLFFQGLVLNRRRLLAKRRRKTSTR